MRIGRQSRREHGDTSHGRCWSGVLFKESFEEMACAFVVRTFAATMLAAGACVLASAFSSVRAESDDIRIAHIYSKTGPLESFARQNHDGLMMGLSYATEGTMKVAGKRIVMIEKDDQGKPDVGKAALATAYGDDKADIAVGPTGSSVAMAMTGVAEEYKKILLIENAVADVLTGAKWNKYLFRTIRSSSQDAIGNAIALDSDGVSIATLAQDSAYGKDGVKAFREALKKAKVVHQEFLPSDTSDFTAGGQRIIDKLKDLPGRKVIFIVWAGTNNPFKIADLDLKRYDIHMATLVTDLPTLAHFKKLPGMEGATYYYYGIPKNPINDALVKMNYEKSGGPPDFFVAAGFTAGLALVEALKRTNGDVASDKLMAAMEGMTFDTPKGKMTFRKEDHQALQSMYQFEIVDDPVVAWGVPKLVREITADEMHLPIRNKR
ncbi:substrate-binding domain-containing protein [Streptomyces sp. AcH 505]|uniref:ABC transporter substrate-binding protein n=1 Tax=Streptomyces sp. AcH 505 TaxID=352211 RepID=UPI0018E2FFC1